MTLSAIGGFHYWPLRLVNGGVFNSNLGTSNLSYDSATDRFAYVGNSPIADAITEIYFRTGAVTTGCDVDVRVESVSNGRPSGTLLNANSNVVVTIDNADDNVWKTAALTAAATLTAGQQFAIVLVVSSGTPNLNLKAVSTVAHGMMGQYPLLLHDTGGGTWAS